MRDINRYVTREFAADWEKVGIELGLTTSILKVVAKNKHHQAEDCFQEVMDKWLNRNVSATWRTLEVALTNVRRQQLGLDPVDYVYYGKDIIQ